MKKNYIKLMAAAVLVLLSACQMNEIENGENPVIGKNVVAFSLRGAETRSAVAVSDFARKGAIIPLGSDGQGHNFYLEETVIDLNAPITRGTPAYTENVVTLYGGKLFAHSALGDDTYKYEESSQCYTYSYGTNIWDVANPLKFWMYMPADLTGTGVTLTENPYGGAESGAQTISFSYESPASAASQVDVLFAARSVSEDEYETNNKKMDVLFHHALTGVKFAIGNDEDDIDDNKIQITKVTFNGLHDKGSCIVTPTTEGGKYQDVTSNYSSQTEGVVVWTLPTAPDNPKAISAEFGASDTITFAKPAEGSTTGSFTNKGKYPASFAAKGGKNLNDGNASKTFWLIPQTISKNVTLTINYTFDGKSYEWPLRLGTALEGSVWKAGQLRSFTIRIDEVNVQIDDKVTMADASTQTIETPWGDKDFVSYEGSKKDSVKIANTGNTDAFIRAALIGQWLDEEDNPVFGFTDYTHGIQLVDSWYQDQFVNKRRKHGTFTGLVGYDTSYSGDWVLGEDGYYYYTKKVAPGKIIGLAPVGAANAGDYLGDPLFISYTVGEVPGAAVAGKAKDVYFVLEIATQAISAKKQDGTDYTWDEAWANAKAQI